VRADQLRALVGIAVNCPSTSPSRACDTKKNAEKKVKKREMASHDGVGIGDFVLLDEITVKRVVDNLKTRYVCCPCYSLFTVNLAAVAADDR